MLRLGMAILVGAALVWASQPAAGSPAGSTTVDARGATVDLTAYRVRIADHPAFVRVVVDFTDGRLGSNDSEAADPDPFPDGRVAVDVRHRRVQAQAPARQAAGVRVRITQASNRIRVHVSARARRFKYLHRWQLTNPDRVVLDLYKSRPPAAAAEIRTAPDGCLALSGWRVSAGRIAARGSARFLFENTFSLTVRGRRGAVVGTRVVTVAQPSGPWRRRVAYQVTGDQRGTLEAVAMSARDGALDCLAQVGVGLRAP